MTTDSKPTCQLIQTTEHFHGKQGLDYGGAISTERVGSQAICMHIVNFPPKARANAHLHENHETAIYMLQGKTNMWYGENLEEHMEAKAGDFIYIPAGMPHLPYNPSDTEPAMAVLSRTDPNEQESVKLLPELDSLR